MKNPSNTPIPVSPRPKHPQPGLRQELLTVNSHGVVYLPDWVWKALVKKSGIRSKKYRIQKKAVRREFQKLLWAELEKDPDWVSIASNTQKQEKQ